MGHHQRECPTKKNFHSLPQQQRFPNSQGSKTEQGPRPQRFSQQNAHSENYRQGRNNGRVPSRQ